MSPPPSKKRILLDIFESRRNLPVEPGDLYAARDELRRQLGRADRTSLSYLASILRRAGYEVRYQDRYSDPIMPEPYATRLKGTLQFHDLPSTEQSLARLDAIYREYRGAGDHLGVKLVREWVKRGKLRARSLAANPRVQDAKRREKQEIARWFQVWLETPDLFQDWLELRKLSEEFRNLLQ